MKTIEKSAYRPINKPIILPRPSRGVYDLSFRKSWGLPELNDQQKPSIDMINAVIEPEANYILHHMGNPDENVPVQKRKNPSDPCIGSQYGF